VVVFFGRGGPSFLSRSKHSGNNLFVRYNLKVLHHCHFVVDTWIIFHTLFVTVFVICVLNKVVYFSYEILHPNYVNIFTCSTVILSVTLLLLTGTCPVNANTWDVSRDISIPNCFVVLCKVYNARVKFFWVVMPCSTAIGYQYFRGHASPQSWR